MATLNFNKVFNVYPDTESKIQALATFDEDFNITGVKLLSKVPRGMYYSVLNDALKEAENVYIGEPVK